MPAHDALGPHWEMRDTVNGVEVLTILLVNEPPRAVLLDTFVGPVKIGGQHARYTSMKAAKAGHRETVRSMR